MVGFLLWGFFEGLILNLGFWGHVLRVQDERAGADFLVDLSGCVLV